MITKVIDLEMERAARKNAIHYLYLEQVMPFYSRHFKGADRRTRYGKAWWQYYYQYRGKITVDIDAIIKKRKKRQSARFIYVPIKDNPIVLDWMHNRIWCKAIYNDHLQFVGWRNHWAKTAQDYRWLEILRKYHPEKAK